ncbi:hypothetical protein ACJJTC_017556, partial [Scirpophaga incertulas]
RRLSPTVTRCATSSSWTSNASLRSAFSQSAVRTKFAQHSRRGKNIAADVMAVLDLIYNTATERKSAMVEKQRILHEQLTSIEDQLTAVTKQNEGEDQPHGRERGTQGRY